MKNKHSILTIFFLFILLLSACSSEEAKQRSYIKAGDKAFKSGKMELAEEKYRLAGELGEDKLTELLLIQAAKHTEKGPESYNYLRAIECFLKLPDNAYTQKEVLLTVIDTAEKYIQYVHKEFPNYNKTQEAFEPVKILEEKIQLKELQEYKEFVFTLGENWASLNIYNERYDEAIQIWKTYSSNPTLKVLADAAELYKNNQPLAGLKLLRENLQDSEKYEHDFYYDLFYPSDKTLQGIIECYSVEAKMKEQPDSELLDKDASWLKNNQFFSEFYGTIDPKSYTRNLTDEEIQYLKDFCGKEADGKILILNKRRPYENDESRLEIHYATAYLPDKYVPERLEEVEYIILLENDYVNTARKYQTGTQIISENTVLSLYKIGTKYPIYKSNKKYTSTTETGVLFFTGKAPAYDSISHPDMTSDMEKALKKIMNDIY